jgi:hypothetical protein
MKTATEVLSWMDDTIANLERDAAGPMTDALIEWTDREAYRDAMRKAYGLKAIRELRDQLGRVVEPNGALPTTKRRSKN